MALNKSLIIAVIVAAAITILTFSNSISLDTQQKEVISSSVEETPLIPEPIEPEPEPVDVTQGFGVIGDEHDHTEIFVIIFGEKFDFSLPPYQLKSEWIHFENQNGIVIHRHASGVTLGYLFDTLGIGLSECLIFDDGEKFCTNDDYSLRFYLNGEQVSELGDYVIIEGDRIVISYGNESLAIIYEGLEVI